jgi:hypothetical protein
MDDQHFNELVTSIKQAGQFLRGEYDPSRKFYFDKQDVKTIKNGTLTNAIRILNWSQSKNLFPQRG